MTWIAALLLAVMCFALSVTVFRLPRRLWTGLAAALTFGLAGYAWQANPAIPSARAAGAFDAGGERVDAVTQRQEFIGDDERSTASLLITADALARRGRYIDASAFLAGVTEQNPGDFEAWLALGIALIEHADGAPTAPALYALQQAARLNPEHPGPGYFLGVSLIRQGRLAEARAVWAETLAAAPADAAGRAGLKARLTGLDGLLSQARTGNPAAVRPAREGAEPAP